MSVQEQNYQKFNQKLFIMKYPIYSSKTVYPEDIQCVWEPKSGKGGIYIGNLQASENLATLKKHGIKAILTAAKDIILRHPKSQIPHHLHVPGEDHERFDLKKYFDKSIDFISSSLKQTNILVHCMAGISRSVTLVLAYLMKHHKMGYQQAYEAVRKRRKIINPNKGFIRQLQEYERFLETQAQAMRRSCDNFQARARDQSLRKTYMGESNVRPTLNQSMRRSIQPSMPRQRQNENRYSTIGSGMGLNKTAIGIGRQNLTNQMQKYNINTKYNIPTRTHKQQPNSYSSYGDLNKQLDEKIAKIRKKYMQATDLLNRQQRKKPIKYNNTRNTRGYFNDLDKSQAFFGYNDDSFMGNEPVMRKNVSAIDQFRNSRAVSNYTGYMNPNAKQMQGYKYYNY